MKVNADEHAKKVLVIRQLLIGRRYFDALAAMEFAAAYHSRLRKDGVTPEFDHQVSIALYALTLADVLYPEALIATIFLHDVREDYGVSDQEVRSICRSEVTAGLVAHAVELLTKTYRGRKKSAQEYFEGLATDPIASLAKGCDRIHNLQSMVGVFSIEKQQAYLTEAQQDIVPILKKARRNFPHQVAAYENIKWLMASQMDLIECVISASKGKADEKFGTK